MRIKNYEETLLGGQNEGNGKRLKVKFLLRVYNAGHEDPHPLSWVQNNFATTGTISNP